MLEEALALLPSEDSPLRARVMARLAGALQPAADPSGPMARARDAIAMARRLGEAYADVRLDVLHTAGAALVDYAPPDERIALSREVVALAEGAAGAPARDRPRALRARLRLVFDHLELANLVGADEALRAYDTAAEAFPQPRYRWPSLLLRAMRALWEGRFEEDRQFTAQAEALAERARDPNLARALAGHRLFAARLAGRSEEARAAGKAYFDLVAGDMGPAVPRHVRLWGALLGTTSPAEAGDALAAFSHDEVVMFCQDATVASFVAEIVVVRDDRALAERLYRALLPRAGSLVVATMTGFAVQELADRVLLWLAATRGAWDDVDRHGADALALADRLGSPPFAAHLRHDWAKALIARGRPHDLTRAHALLAEAAAIADRSQMPEVAASCRQALEAMGGANANPPPPPPSSPSPETGVSAVAEGDTWIVTGAGEVCRVRDSRGMRMLARLLSHPGEEVHVLDLAGADREAVDGGDAGEVLDAEARAAYRARLAESRRPAGRGRAVERSGTAGARPARARGAPGRAGPSGRAGRA